MSDERDPLADLVEILGPFREAADANIKTLWRRLLTLEKTVRFYGILLWIILGALSLGLLVSLAFLLTR